MKYSALNRQFSSFLLPYIHNSSINPCCYYSLQSRVLSGYLHCGREIEENRGIVHEVCSSLRKGHNWEILTRKYDSIELNRSLVEKILLELKEPIDAKRGLGFFHWVAQRKSFVHGVQTYAIMLHVLVKAKLITDAQALLESVLKKWGGTNSVSKFLVVDSLIGNYERTSSSPFVFDLLIRGYAKLRMFEVGFDVCSYLKEKGFGLSIVSFNTLMHVVHRSDKFFLAWKIYEHMIRSRVYPNEATNRIMVDCLCKEGKLQVFVEKLDSIIGKRCSPLVIVNTSLVFKVLEERRVEDGMSLLKVMLQKYMIPDTVAYSLVVYTKVLLGDLSAALAVHEEMLDRGFNANSFVCTSLIGGYIDIGRIDDAKLLLQEMESMDLKPYSDTFNFLIEGCAKAGRVKESLSYCEKMMERGLLPSTMAFTEMQAKLNEGADVKQADEILTRLLDKGFSAAEITYSHLIVGYLRNNDINNALKLYYEMEYCSISPGSLVLISLVRSLCRFGKLEEAKRYFRKMKERSIDPGKDVS